MDNIRRRIVGVMFPPSIFEDRCVDFRRTMCRLSNIGVALRSQDYGVPFVSKLKMMLVFTIHAGIYDSCWYLRSMLVFTLHAGIVNTSMKCKYQHES